MTLNESVTLWSETYMKTQADIIVRIMVVGVLQLSLFVKENTEIIPHQALCVFDKSISFSGILTSPRKEPLNMLPSTSLDTFESSWKRETLCHGEMGG